LANIIDKLLRAGEGRILAKLRNYADAINALEVNFNTLSDEELQNETTVLRERYAAGESLDDMLPEAFAAVREAAKRTLGMRPFDVQLMGGAALHLGNIAEMGTGEGKTLVATLPAYLNAIAGRGVHVVTVNDFLAGYQSELMGRVFRALGMTTGCIISNQEPSVRPTTNLVLTTFATT
jgi:preprotein translocase subunit SecA